MSRTYIVDIDGTLADMRHRLHFIEQEPKNWDGFFDACHGDTPIRDVIDVIRSVAWPSAEAGENPTMVYLTGRPERVRLQTKTWMARNGIPAGELIMRKDGDHRPDTIAKRELLESLISEGCKVVGVFEDRPSVCRVWREMGLTVFQLKHEEF